jgi:type III secretory pathway component EscS
MIVFGALDLYALFRVFPKVIWMIETSYNGNLYQLLVLVMVISLIVSGPLILMGNRIGYVIYYFQFPLRLTTIPSLTFGFLMRIPTTVGTLFFGMLLATIYALEAIRLMYTIQKHRVLN